MFPLFLALLPPSSPHLGPILDALRDPEQLWSPYGLRSLSASHPQFGTGENYWKGPVWVQMNYLALRALYKVTCLFLMFQAESDSKQKYAVEEGPYKARAQEIYQQLRKNIIDNVFKVGLLAQFWTGLDFFWQEYERTGYVWEQYDALTGTGMRRLVPCILSLPCHLFGRSHPFTGWTSLVTLSECMFVSSGARKLIGSFDSSCGDVLIVESTLYIQRVHEKKLSMHGSDIVCVWKWKREMKHGHQNWSASKDKPSKCRESSRISPMVRSGSSSACLVLGGGRGYISSVGVWGNEPEVDGTVEPRDRVGGEGGRGAAVRGFPKLRMERRRRMVEEKVRADGVGDGARRGMLSRSSSSSSRSSSSSSK
jgi:hypothetical protein